MLGPNRRSTLYDWVGIGGSQFYDASLVTGYANASMRMNSSNISNGTRAQALGGAYDHVIIAADCRRTAASGQAAVWNFGVGFDTAADAGKYVLSAAGRTVTNHHLVIGPVNATYATSSLAVATGVWMRIALEVKLHASTGYIRYYVDDWETPILEVTGDTIAILGSATVDRARIVGNNQGRICNVVVCATSDATEALDRMRVWHAGVWLQSPAANGTIDQSFSGTFEDINDVPIELLTEVVMQNTREFTARLAAPPSSAKSALAANLWQAGSRDSVNAVNGFRLFAFDGQLRETSGIFPTPIVSTRGEFLTNNAPNGDPLTLDTVADPNWQWGYRAGSS